MNEAINNQILLLKDYKDGKWLSYAEEIKMGIGIALGNENFKKATDFGDFKSEFIDITEKGITIKFYSEDKRMENVNLDDYAFEDYRVYNMFWLYVNELVYIYINERDLDNLRDYLFKINSPI